VNIKILSKSAFSLLWQSGAASKQAETHPKVAPTVPRHLTLLHPLFYDNIQQQRELNLPFMRMIYYYLI
jgi:hypothetical protein